MKRLLALFLLISSCSTTPPPEENGKEVEEPKPEVKNGGETEGPAPRPDDTPELARMRKALEEGKLDTAGIHALAASRVLVCISAVADFLATKPVNEKKEHYERRMEALFALRSIRDTDPIPYRLSYDRVKAALAEEASRGSKASLTDVEFRALSEAMEWHGENRYIHAKMMMMTMLSYSPHEKVKRKFAHSLRHFVGDSAVATALWKAVEDPDLPAGIRGTAIDSLFTIQGKNLNLKRLGLIRIDRPDKELDLRRKVRAVREQVDEMRKEK